MAKDKRRKVDVIGLQNYKRARKEGKGKTESLIEAGIAPISAHHNQNTLAMAKYGDAEVLEELKASDITPEMVINRLNEDRAGAIAKGDWATATRVEELLGKYIALWTDRLTSDTKLTIQPDEQDELIRLRQNIITN